MIYILFVFGFLYEFALGQLWPMSAYPMQQFPGYGQFFSESELSNERSVVAGSDSAYPPPPSSYYDQSTFSVPYQQPPYSSLRRPQDYGNR